MDTASRESSGAHLGQSFENVTLEDAPDARSGPLGPITSALVETSAFLRVESGPDLLREVRGSFLVLS